MEYALEICLPVLIKVEVSPKSKNGHSHDSIRDDKEDLAAESVHQEHGKSCGKHLDQ